MRKTLRLPVGDEWLSLPATKELAIQRGLSRFVPEDGNLRIIRRYGSRLYPTGKIELDVSRKKNRGGPNNQRLVNEALATPQWADRNAYLQAMSDAAGKGKEGHHNRPVSRTAEGIRFSEQRGRSSAEQIHSAYEKVNQPLGNQKGNIEAEYTQRHNQIHRQYDAMDDGIARAGQGPDQIFKTIQGAVSFNAAAVFAKLNGNGNGGNGNGNGQKNGNGKPNGKPNGNISPALNRGVIKSTAGAISFALQPVTTSVDTGLHGPHIFIP